MVVRGELSASKIEGKALLRGRCPEKEIRPKRVVSIVSSIEKTENESVTVP